MKSEVTGDKIINDDYSKQPISEIGEKLMARSDQDVIRRALQLRMADEFHWRAKINLVNQQPDTPEAANALVELRAEVARRDGGVLHQINPADWNDE